jgi:hypothetical protein
MKKIVKGMKKRIPSGQVLNRANSVLGVDCVSAQRNEAK